MGGGASKASTASGGDQESGVAVDPITKLSPQYIISNGIIRLRGDLDKMNNHGNNQNEVQVIQAEGFSNKKRVDAEMKDMGHSGGHAHDEPVVEDIDDAGSIVGGIPA